jgi:hypothetical protein
MIWVLLGVLLVSLASLSHAEEPGERILTSKISAVICRVGH